MIEDVCQGQVSLHCHNQSFRAFEIPHRGACPARREIKTRDIFALQYFVKRAETADPYLSSRVLSGTIASTRAPASTLANAVDNRFNSDTESESLARPCR